MAQLDKDENHFLGNFCLPNQFFSISAPIAETSFNAFSLQQCYLYVVCSVWINTFYFTFRIGWQSHWNFSSRRKILQRNLEKVKSITVASFVLALPSPLFNKILTPVQSTQLHSPSVNKTYRKLGNIMEFHTGAFIVIDYFTASSHPLFLKKFK